MQDGRIEFTPEMQVPLGEMPVVVPVKGQLPRLDYPFALRDVYPLVPVLNPLRAYREIAQRFEQVDVLVQSKLRSARGWGFPPARDDTQAVHFLAALFDPASCQPGSRDGESAVLGDASVQLLRLSAVRPYPLRLASPSKIAHTLAWIDTNIKVVVEGVAEAHRLPAPTTRQIVELAFWIYSLLVKQQDYFLAQSMNFNYSMFLQDRTLHLMFGEAVRDGGGSAIQCGQLANDVALQLLKGLSSLSYQQLCTLSVFMGVIWASGGDLQRDYLARSEDVLGNIESEIASTSTKWSINHIDLFLRDMSQLTGEAAVAVVLDDNGESVFDVALFQRLLDDTDRLHVTFVVNQYPVSNNIALDTFRALVDDPYFSSLKKHLEAGRVRLCLESQMFRSFELDYLSPATLDALGRAMMIYVKGANFFETFQRSDNVRYHCFTVYGRTSISLTGCPERTGIFARLERGVTGYTYHSATHIVTLRDKVAGAEGGAVGN